MLRAQRTLGVDLNHGHIDAAVIDPYGNVVGTPRRIDYTIDGTTSHRDAQVRHVVEPGLVEAVRQDDRQALPQEQGVGARLKLDPHKLDACVEPFQQWPFVRGASKPVVRTP